MSVEEAVDRLASAEFVRVVAHADADGVASAACLCSALTRAGVGYHFTALDDPSEVASADGDVFCDLGAGYLDRIGDAVVIDHHPPRGSFDGVLVGTDAPSSSVAAYRVASLLSSGNPVTALVGALGDGVPPEDVPGVLDDAVAAGVERREGTRLVGSNAVEALTYSTRPFTRLSGDLEAAREFVESVDEDDLPTAVVLLALTNEAARADAVAEVVGEIYRLPSGVHLHEVSRYTEACAVSGKGGLAFSTCLSPTAHIEEARSAWRAFESSLIETVRGARVEEGDPSFAYIDGPSDTGAVADVLADWVTGDVVVVGDGEASLRAEGFDCERVASEAAATVDGAGGGHASRAGASFDATRERFVEAVKEALV
ncbi:MAG: DHHA1 domain-containing protein [Halobacteriales archaeon]